MKKRTIEELHDKRVGHIKFAKACDLFIEKGHTLTNIKEYYEKFSFELDNFHFEYSKDWKASVKDFVEYTLNLLAMAKELKARELK